MPTASRPLRLLLLAVLALALAALLWTISGALRSALALWQELRAQPAWLQIAAGLLFALGVLACAWIAWKLLRPRRRRAQVAAPTRDQIEQRVAQLQAAHADTAALQEELEELDRRARSQELYVAVFGEISAGKSSLIRALAPGAAAQVDVLGGTTRAVTHYRATLAPEPSRARSSTSMHEPDSATAPHRDSVGALDLVLADVPGTHEAAGVAREQLARDEALRAHIVLYVCDGDLTREQDAELRWLRSFGKPLVLLLNKADQFGDGERAVLEQALRERYAALTDAQLAVSAGGIETFERTLADGRREQVRRERSAQLGALRELLARYATHGAGAFERSREAAVLSALGARADVLETQTRDRASEAIVTKYTQRAVVGALAAVMPGSDLVIQGVLATALIRELGKLHGVSLRDIDIDAFLGQVKLTVRTSTSLVLAIAGNALKAFPGLGTLGGGVLHAVAYGLIFDSLGRAVATTLRDQRALDTAAATASLAQLLADASAQRLRRIAQFALKPDPGDR